MTNLGRTLSEAHRKKIGESLRKYHKKPGATASWYDKFSATRSQNLEKIVQARAAAMLGTAGVPPEPPVESASVVKVRYRSASGEVLFTVTEPGAIEVRAIVAEDTPADPAAVLALLSRAAGYVRDNSTSFGGSK